MTYGTLFGNMSVLCLLNRHCERTAPSLLQGCVVPAVMTTMSCSDFWLWHSFPEERLLGRDQRPHPDLPRFTWLLSMHAIPATPGSCSILIPHPLGQKWGSSGSLSLQRLCRTPVPRLNIPVFARFEKARRFHAILRFGWLPLRRYT